MSRRPAVPKTARAALRATMIALLLFSDVVSLASAALMPAAAHASSGHLLGAGTLKWALWLAPAMLAGIWWGQRSFKGVSPAQFRRHVLNLLVALAAVSVARSVVSLATA